MTPDENKIFDDLADEMTSDTANGVLDRQMARARKWRAQRLANGESDSLREFIRTISREPNKRSHILASYGAAMYRLMEVENEAD